MGKLFFWGGGGYPSILLWNFKILPTATHNQFSIFYYLFYYSLTKRHHLQNTQFHPPKNFFNTNIDVRCKSWLNLWQKKYFIWIVRNFIFIRLIVHAFFVCIFIEIVGNLWDSFSIIFWRKCSVINCYLGIDRSLFYWFLGYLGAYLLDDERVHWTNPFSRLSINKLQTILP